MTSNATYQWDDITIVTPFGVRFCDYVTGEVVSEGLSIVAYPRGNPRRTVSGMINRRGVFTFRGLPGMHDIENGKGDDQFWDTISPPKEFIIQARDQRGRFQPFQFDAFLPIKNLYQWEALPRTSPQATLPYVPLYPSPARPALTGFGVVRSELWDGLNNCPAAWAMVEVRMEGELKGRSFADKNGRIAVLFAYPEPADHSATSPPVSPSVIPLTRYSDSKWNVQLTAYYSPTRDVPSVPDLVVVHEQTPAAIGLNDSSSLTELDLILEFGKECIVKSSSKSELLIIPAGSPL